MICENAIRLLEGEIAKAGICIKYMECKSCNSGACTYEVQQIKKELEYLKGMGE